jgi:hypothetical protein
MGLPGPVTGFPLYFCDINLAYLIIVQDTVHVRIFITFHLVINRSRCTDFYLIKEGTQNIGHVFRVCVLSYKVFRDKRFLGDVGLCQRNVSFFSWITKTKGRTSVVF